MVDQVAADRGVVAGHLRHHQLGPDPVGGGDEDGLGHPGESGRNRPPKLPISVRTPGVKVDFASFLTRVSAFLLGVDVDAGGGVGGSGGGGLHGQGNYIRPELEIRWHRVCS